MQCHKCPVGGSMAPQVQPGPGAFRSYEGAQTREGGRRLLETPAPGGEGWRLGWGMGVGGWGLQVLVLVNCAVVLHLN